MFNINNITTEVLKLLYIGSDVMEIVYCRLVDCALIMYVFPVDVKQRRAPIISQY